jgi:hypothetical protein
MKLHSGDAREVGSYEDRALLLMPGGQCERDPALSDIGGRLSLTWRESKPDTNEEFGTIRLVVPADAIHPRNAGRSIQWKCAGR